LSPIITPVRHSNSDNNNKKKSTDNERDGRQTLRYNITTKMCIGNDYYYELWPTYIHVHVHDDK